MPMAMLGATIHSIERRLWQQETRRRTHPFAWGAEILGGADGDARAFLQRYAAQALAKSEDFSAPPGRRSGISSMAAC